MRVEARIHEISIAVTNLVMQHEFPHLRGEQRQLTYSALYNAAYASQSALLGLIEGREQKPSEN